MFIGLEHRLRGEAEMNACSKKGDTIAAADARSTKEVEDGRRTLGGVMVAVRKEVASVVDTAGSNVDWKKKPGKGLAQIWLSCNGGLVDFKPSRSIFGTQKAGRQGTRHRWKP